MISLCAPQAPIGVFDSGIGGLSVLRALQQRMPAEHFVYVADSGHAPYGEKTTQEIYSRSATISRFLREEQGCKALVIACNTATAAAAAELRKNHGNWPIIGIEPAIKPAASQSRTGRIAVWATRATLASDKYQCLQAQILNNTPDLHIQAIACDGLATAVEALAHDPSNHLKKVQDLVSRYALNLSADTDTLVLGCTHYPLVAELIQAHVPSHVQLLDPGSRVAEHTHAVLSKSGLLVSNTGTRPALSLWSSEQVKILGPAVNHWLQISSDPVGQLCV